MHRFMRGRNIEDVPRLVALVAERTGRRFDPAEVEASMGDEGAALAPLFFRSVAEALDLDDGEVAEMGRAYMLCGPGPTERAAQAELAR